MTVAERLSPLWCRSWRAADCELEIKRVDERDGVVVVTALTYVSEAGALRDIKEQEVFFGDAGDYDEDARDAAAAAAYAVVIAEVMAGIGRDRFEALMPADLVCGDLAGLGNCETQGQFEKALRAKKRLGRFLAPTGG